jgi:hypothetical protein
MFSILDFLNPALAADLMILSVDYFANFIDG